MLSATYQPPTISQPGTRLLADPTAPKATAPGPRYPQPYTEAPTPPTHSIHSHQALQTSQEANQAKKESHQQSGIIFTLLTSMTHICNTIDSQVLDKAQRSINNIQVRVLTKAASRCSRAAPFRTAAMASEGSMVPLKMEESKVHGCSI